MAASTLHRLVVDPHQALDDLGGAARYGELRRLGVSEKRLRRAVHEGRVEMVGPGTYALPWAEPAVKMASRFRAHIGCVTACEHWGLPLWEDHATPHLVVPRHRSPSQRDPREMARVVLHRTSSPLPDRRWLPVAQAVDQAAWCTSPVGQLVLVDAALHAGILLPGDLAHCGEGDDRRRRWLRRMASGTAESPPETVARVAMVTAGLSVRAQVAVPGVGRVDFVVEDALVVEIDGWAFHGSRDAFEADRARDRRLLARAMPVMRFTAKQVRDDPCGMVREIAGVLGRAPHADFDRRMRWVLGHGPEVFGS